MDIGKQVGQNIRRLRLERDIAQERLALDAGIDRAYLSGIERGKKNPSVEILAQIAAVLEVRVSDLVADPPEKKPMPKNLNRGRHVTKKRKLRKLPKPKSKR